MNQRILFSFTLVLSVILCFSLVSAATSCDVAVGTTHILPSDFTDQQSTARVLVHGEGTGSFTEETTATIDCNVNNLEPKPLEKTVNARLTLSTSTLAYSANCYYPKPQKDTKYTVGAKVDGTECLRSVDLGAVTTPGFGTVAPNLTQILCGHAGEKECTTGEPCKTPAVPDGYGKCTTCPSGTTPSNGKCVGGETKKTCSVGQTLVNGVCATRSDDDVSGLVCLDGSKPVNGECPSRKKGCPEGSIEDTFTGQCYEDPHAVKPVCPEGSVYDRVKKGCVVKKVEKELGNDLPALPDDEETFTITLKNKYTFIGIPFEDAQLVSESCTDENYYVHTPETNQFVKMPPVDSNSQLRGKGLLVKIPVGQECTLVFKGSFSEEQSFDLKKGWNLISPQTHAFENAKNRKSDCAFLSPFVGLDGKYFKEQTMKPGAGYFVKVKNDCTLSTKDALDLPRLPS